MKVRLLILLPVLIFLTGCKLEGPEERAIREMVATFIAAVDRDDTVLAEACLMDMEAFRILNPDAGARLDAESFSESVIADLRHSYNNLVRHFEGKSVVLKKFYLGPAWYQYKGHSAFKDNEVVVSVDGEDVAFTIPGIVRVGEHWLITDLSGIELY